MLKMFGVAPETLELVLSSKTDNKKVMKILGVSEDKIMSGKYNGEIDIYQLILDRERFPKSAFIFPFPQ